MNDNSATLNAHSSRLPIAARSLLCMLERLQRGRLELLTPEGEQLHFSGPEPGPQAQLQLHDWGVCQALLTSGDIGFAEGYRDGRWSSPDLTALLTLAVINEAALTEAIHGRWWSRLLYRARHWLRSNTRRGSRRNIHAHYDIGNDFYRLWLDPSMTYSAALFSEPDQALVYAQQAKYERILQQLKVEPGHHILEIGCGWGGFAEYAAQTRGCRVTGITLSPAQLEWARARIARAGLADRVQLELCDYRDVGGRYDRVVSIEMFEAVGERYWRGYFDIVHERLQPGGRALIQTISIADDCFERYRSGSDFIQQYIFPGGMLPSPQRLARIITQAQLRVTDRLAFGADYATTLQHWRERFDAAGGEVRALGYDAGLIRLWRFYLAYCEAGFRSGRTDVLQLELERTGP